MKKTVIVCAVLLVIASAATIILYLYAVNKLPNISIIKIDNREGNYLVYQNDNFLRAFNDKDEAIKFAKSYTQTYVTKSGSDEWVWDNFPQFLVNDNGETYIFGSFYESLAYSRGKTGAYIENRGNKSVIWRNDDVVPSSYIIEGVPLIAQNPELERGCEVTSLAMLLNYYGIGVSKMDLAEQIEKDTTHYSIDKKGVITFGNPQKGFVGDIYSKKNPGLGVYNGPIFALLKTYIGSSALNLTGADFSDLYYFISKDKPVWVITNYTFKPLANDKFLTWKTESGPVIVTYSEHSVLIKGYDENNIYFNDPLNGKGSRSVPKADFISAWDQMGRQAVTYFE